MLWQKSTQVEDWVIRFTVGEDALWDTLLLPYDLRGTEAHAWGLSQIGILSPAEFEQVATTLQHLAEEAEVGHLVVTTADEDCHTVIEKRLTAHLGDIGKKIHTGRSRNDQVLTALRLFLKDRLADLVAQTTTLTTHLCHIGETQDDVLLPGYTHLQQAMPSTVGLWALGYAELLLGDLSALQQAFEHIDTSPLGSAAGYGVPHLDLPRQAVAERLGFSKMQLHVTAVQLSRGKLELHVLHALLQTAQTVNRLASDLILYNTTEFGFVTLPAAYCTGSSIMPQKQNPDVLELARATYHRLLGEMHVLMTLSANLPSGYHRDMQLTKAAVMRGVLLGSDLLTAMNHVLPGVTFRAEATEKACSPGLFATALALEQVQAGQPFREAYRSAAQQVATLEKPSGEDVFSSYHTPGTPGKGDAAYLRQQLRTFRSWIETVSSAASA